MGPVAWSDQERAELENSGLAVSAYAAVRAAGAAHHEVMEAHVLGADLATYAVFRSGHPHRRALDEVGAPGSPSHDDARRLGVSVAELAEVRASHRSTVDAYWMALTVDGRPPSDDIPVTRIGDYLMARRGGLDHGNALGFAVRVTTLKPRPDPRDLALWARCQAAGLPAAWTFTAVPRGRGRMLGWREIEVLTALLGESRGFDPAPIDIGEMVWLACRSDSHRLDLAVFLAARADGRSRRTALRVARRDTASV